MRLHLNRLGTARNRMLYLMCRELSCYRSEEKIQKILEVRSSLKVWGRTYVQPVPRPSKGSRGVHSSCFKSTDLTISSLEDLSIIFVLQRTRLAARFPLTWSLSRSSLCFRRAISGKRAPRDYAVHPEHNRRSASSDQSFSATLSHIRQ